MRILDAYIQTTSDDHLEDLAEPRLTVTIAVDDLADGLRLLQDIAMMVNPPDDLDRPESPESE
jgi:hypothetical protein